MIEAPEVNVLITQLKEYLKDSMYTDTGHKIVDIYRDGKNLAFKLLTKNDKSLHMIIHFTLKGHLSLEKNKNTLYTFKFANDKIVYLNDPIKLAFQDWAIDDDYASYKTPFENCIKDHPNMMLKRVLIRHCCYPIGLGVFLTKELIGILKHELKMDTNIRCKNLTDEDIQKIRNRAEELITDVTNAGGKHTFTDLYGNNSGKYYSKY